MGLSFPKFGKTRTEPGRDLEKIRSAFSKFQRIQKLNTRVLGIMAEMERALGGEYIFDRSFLERSIRDASAHVYQVVYSLNALSDNGYISLFDRFQSIRRALEDVLAGGLGSFEARCALPFSELGLEMEPLAGGAAACLAEIRNHLDISVPDGFVVTVTGCREFIRWHRGKGVLSGPVLPARLENSILRERDALFNRCGGPVSLTVRACLAGEYGVAQPRLEPAEGVLPEALLKACRKALDDSIEAIRAAGIENCAVALTVQEAIPAGIAGSAAIGPAAGLLRIIAAPAAGPEEKEVYLVRRDYPYDLIRSDILPKNRGTEIDSGTTALSLCAGVLRRGSAFLDPAFLKSLSGAAAAIERIIGRPCRLKWARGDGGRLVVLDVNHEAVTNAAEPAEPVDLRGTQLLLSGGETAQAGISAGKTAHVTETTEMERIPPGAVVVSRAAVPQLSRVLKRAAAIITETGTSVCHLAAIARELRVPAVFGVADALGCLPEGIEVTVDAGERSVYSGIVHPLLENRSSGSELLPNDPEYVLLRLLLRLVMPLSLIDPESADFRSENCRTFHDIIHFCHEKSVEELLRFPERQSTLGLKPRRLAAGVPMDLYVLELDNAASEQDGWLQVEDLRSEPFHAFIRGITQKEMWAGGAASFTFRDIFSNLDRTFGIMNGPDYAGRNLAVVAKNYMNLGLRLGYHQSVIDSFLGDNASQNYVYFRFAGGFADERRRRRRVEFMRVILDALHFKVSIKGDLLVGTFKIADRAETTAVLTTLGQLTAFTRQLDTSMESEKKIEEYARVFLTRSIQAGADCDKEPDSV